MSEKVKISELLEKLYKGHLLSDKEYEKYLLMVKAYRIKENNENRRASY